LNVLLDIFYPKRCPVCDRLLGLSEGLVHPACQTKLRYVQGPVCCRCGKPVSGNETEYCSDCLQRRHYYESGHAVWIYDDWMRQSVGRYKYHGAKAYADFYARQIVAVYGAWLQKTALDVLVPVPVHWRKKNQRGFNQAEVLAKKVGQLTGIPVDTKYLVRRQWTQPQKSLTPIQRYMNLKKAFKVRNGIKSKVRNKAENKVGKKNNYPVVVLIDDIYTTGSTIDACASVLKAAGTKKVYYISLCTGSDDGG